MLVRNPGVGQTLPRSIRAGRRGHISAVSNYYQRVEGVPAPTTDPATLPGPRPADSAGERELHRLADVSLADFLRHLSRYGGAVEEEDGLLLFHGAHRQPNPYRNGVLCLEDELPARQVLERADRFFGARKAGYAVWTREHADAELDEIASRTASRDLERLPELVLFELPEPAPAPDGVELRAATDGRTRDDYLRVVADAWGFGSMPLELAAQVFFAPESIDAPNVVAFVAYYDDQPLSGAMCLLSHGVALGCQAATIRRPRRGQRLPRRAPGGRGLAESCLYAALEVSFRDLGASLSLCQTSKSGEPVWRTFGYHPLTSYGRYLLIPGAAP